jgi:hypothetical protein
MSFIQKFRLSDRPGDLGLACNARGLDLASVPLLNHEAGRFKPRPLEQIKKLLGYAYGVSGNAERLGSGLQAVANALNERDITRAMVAALRLRLPPLDWDGAVRILQAENALAKYDPNEPRDWHGRWTSEGSAHSNPPAASTPRGSPVSPFQPVSPPHIGYGGWPLSGGTHTNPIFHLAAAEEDENGRGGLLDNFTDLPRQYRLEYYEYLQGRLRDIEPGNPMLETIAPPDYSPTRYDINRLYTELRAAQERAGEPPATAWELGWGARGVTLEYLRLAGKRTLPPNTPTIDDFSNQVALSIKTIDLNAPWYRNPGNLSYRIGRYVDKLFRFNNLYWNGNRIGKEYIQGRVLDIVIPKNSGTPAQMRAVEDAIERARQRGVHIVVNPY